MMPKGTDRDDPHKYLDPVALAKVRSLLRGMDRPCQEVNAVASCPSLI